MNIFQIVISVSQRDAYIFPNNELIQSDMKIFRITWHTIISTDQKRHVESLSMENYLRIITRSNQTLIEFCHLILSLGTIHKLENGDLPSFIHCYETVTSFTSADFFFFWSFSLKLSILLTMKLLMLLLLSVSYPMYGNWMLSWGAAPPAITL